LTTLKKTQSGRCGGCFAQQDLPHGCGDDVVEAGLEL